MMEQARILIVDDEPFQLRLLSRQLANLGQHAVDACGSGPQALALIDALPVDQRLIFLDLNMPGMDGVEFVRHLVDITYAGAMVLVSGEDARILETVVLLARAHHLNVIGQLTKPVQPEALKSLLDKWQDKTPKPHATALKAYAPAELRRAFECGELINYYQPKVEVKSGVFKGVETLVRWQHPTDGLVFPAQFIGVAEEHGLIDELTRIVLTQALEQSRRWRDVGWSLRVAVNVSMYNLVQRDFLDFVLRQVIQSGIAAVDLILEITESQLMTNGLAALETLTRLRLKHISLSIDDFGTGHSSLAQLRDIPFDELKIDGSFVHGASRHNTRHAIFTASLAMARQLRMASVGEGVENQEDWDFVRAEGCELAQGYFIARPMAADDLPAWLADWERRGLQRAAASASRSVSPLPGGERV